MAHHLILAYSFDIFWTCWMDHDVAAVPFIGPNVTMMTDRAVSPDVYDGWWLTFLHFWAPIRLTKCRGSALSWKVNAMAGCCSVSLWVMCDADTKMFVFHLHLAVGEMFIGRFTSTASRLYLTKAFSRFRLPLNSPIRFRTMRVSPEPQSVEIYES